MSGVNGPDGINPINGMNSNRLERMTSHSTPQTVKFGGFHNPIPQSSSRCIEKRLSAAALQQFQTLVSTYDKVEFQEYPEEHKIPQLIIGDDFIEDNMPPEKCEV